MNYIIILIRAVLVLLIFSTIAAFLNSFSLNSFAIASWGLGLFITIWWVTTNMSKKVPPKVYLPKVAIISGVLLIYASALSIIQSVIGQQGGLIQAFATGIGGYFIIRIGNNPKVLNKRVVRD